MIHQELLRNIQLGIHSRQNLPRTWAVYFRCENAWMFMRWGYEWGSLPLHSHKIMVKAILASVPNRQPIENPIDPN